MYLQEATVECVGLIGNHLPGFYIVTSSRSHPILGKSSSLMNEVISVYKNATESFFLTCLNTIAMVLNVT